MAFGQEIKDFVSSFKTGYDIASKGEDAREKKKAREAKEKPAKDLAAAMDAGEAGAVARMQQGIPVGEVTSDADRVSSSAGVGGLSERAEYIKAGLVDRGLPEHVAQGFLMNFQDESGLDPGINEKNPTVPGSRGGFGLYQVTGPRRKAYEAFAQQKGTSLANLDTTMDFMVHELQTTEKPAYDRIMKAKTAGEAGAFIVNDFLRPAEKHRRARAARYINSDRSPAVREAVQNASWPEKPAPATTAPRGALPVGDPAANRYDDSGEPTSEEILASLTPEQRAQIEEQRRRNAPQEEASLGGGTFGALPTTFAAEGGAVGATADTGAAAKWTSAAPNRQGSVFLNQYEYTPSQRPSQVAPTQPTRSHNSADYLQGNAQKFAAQRQDRAAQFEQTRAADAAKAAQATQMREIAARRETLMRQGVPPWMIGPDGNMVQPGQPAQPFQYSNAPTEAAPEGGFAYGFADGGAVPDEEPLVPFMATQPQAAIAEAPAPRQSFDPSAVAAEGEAKLPEIVRAGMSGISRMFGFDGQAEGIPDPQVRQAGLQRFARNEGAARPSEVREVDSTIDPNGELSNGARQIGRLYAGYKHYLEKGEPQKAANYAASMLMYSKSVMAAAGPLLQVQAERGDLKGAARTVEQAYGAVPDGGTVEAKPGKNGLKVEMFKPDGTLSQRGEISLNQLTQLATGMGNGTLWYRAMGLISQPKGEGLTAYQQEQLKRQNAKDGASESRAEAAARRAQERHDAYMKRGQGGAGGRRLTAAQQREADTNDSAIAEVLGIQGETYNQGNMDAATQPSTPDTVVGAGAGRTGAMPAFAASGADAGISVGNPSAADNQPGAGAPTMALPPGASGAGLGPEATSADQMEKVEGARGLRDERGMRAVRQGMVAADLGYNKAVRAAGVRGAGSEKRAEKVAEAIDETALRLMGGKPKPENRAALASVATAIIRGNPNVSPEDAANIALNMLNKGGGSLQVDNRGRVTIGTAPVPVFLDQQSISRILALRGESPMQGGVTGNTAQRPRSVPAAGRSSSAVDMQGVSDNDRKGTQKGTKGNAGPSPAGWARRAPGVGIGLGAPKDGY